MESICSLTTLVMVCLSFGFGPAKDGAPKSPAKKDATPPWYLKPVVRPTAPTDNDQSCNPIDAFLSRQYRAKALQPAPRADRLTLLRRVHLDLTGLPPTVAEQDAFLADPSPDAYDKLV